MKTGQPKIKEEKLHYAYASRSREQTIQAIVRQEIQMRASPELL
jgi:hypothetical protein